MAHMTMQKQIITISAFLIFLLQLLSATTPVSAQTAEEKNFLLMYFKEEELVVESPTRSLKPVSQVAENITVVTAEDIERMNAHTLADILNNVTGVQVWATGGPGTAAVSFIQGSENRHVTVMIDGVVLNTLGDNVADVGMIPVQMIQKIEIIKGPASSTWGSALGGVVNVITKFGSLNHQGNMVSASFGEKDSDDFRVETMGRQDKLGYYLTAGRLQSDGLTPHFGLSNNNAYGKLSYGLTAKTDLLFTLGYGKIKRDAGQDDINDVSYKNITEMAYSTLAVNSALSKDLSLNISVRSFHQGTTFQIYQVSTGDKLSNDKTIDSGYGASAILTWKNSFNTIVAGLDYDDKALDANIILDGKHTLRKTAVYANDTIVLGKLSLTPGIRFERTNTNGDVTSPSLGIAHGLFNSTILRIYAAEGFDIPPIGYTYGNSSNVISNPDLKPEKVRSYQAGAESADLKYIWMKVSVFRNDIRDAIFLQQDPVTLVYTALNSIRQRRQGIEIEMKTIPVYNTALIAGMEFLNAKDLDTGETLQGIPTRIYDIGLEYNDTDSFKVLLKGRYIDWNAAPSSDPLWAAKDRNYVFDLNMIKKIYRHKDASLEAFVDVHNIFNQDQYQFAYYRNPKQWLEGGLRYAF